MLHRLSSRVRAFVVLACCFGAFLVPTTAHAATLAGANNSPAVPATTYTNDAVHLNVSVDATADGVDTTNPVFEVTFDPSVFTLNGDANAWSDGAFPGFDYATCATTPVDATHARYACSFDGPITAGELGTVSLDFTTGSTPAASRPFAVRLTSNGAPVAATFSTNVVAPTLPPNCSAANNNSQRVLASDPTTDVDVLSSCDDTNGPTQIDSVVQPASGGTLVVIQSTDPTNFAGHDVIRITPANGFTGRVPVQFTASRAGQTTQATSSAHVMTSFNDMDCYYTSRVDDTYLEEGYSQTLEDGVTCSYGDPSTDVVPGDGNNVAVTNVSGPGVSLADAEIITRTDFVPHYYEAVLHLKPHATGDFSFTVTVTHNGVFDTFTRYFHITDVAPIDDAPYCDFDLEPGPQHGGATFSMDLANMCADPEGTPLTYALDTSNPGFVAANGTASITGSTLTWTPNTGYRGYDSAAFKVTDGTNQVSDRYFADFDIYDNADIASSLSGPASGTVGSPLTYTATFSNLATVPSPETLTSGTLSVYLPEDATPGAAPAGCVAKSDVFGGHTERWYECAIANLASGASRSFQITFTPTVASSSTVHPNVSTWAFGSEAPTANDTNNSAGQLLTITGATTATCPSGQTGTPPNCVTPAPTTCPTGQVGTPPNCTTPITERTPTPGPDTFLGSGTTNDTFDGGAGNDNLDGGKGDDTLFGGLGLDKLLGGEGNDKLDGGAGNDTVDGGAGNDTVKGGAGNDTVKGGAGNDTADGGTGNDVVDGGVGNDTVKGGAGNDTVTCGTGTDKASGDAGVDKLSCKDGKGGDVIDGGAGKDTCTGDKKDVFKNCEKIVRK